jgi:HPt (histidine-containing phosphotransfer) domain-containing protein
VSAVIRQSEALQPEPVRGATFDELHFARQTFGDPDLQQEIIQLFLAQVEDARRAFATPMTTTAWRFLTHTLKGAAASVGALRIAELASAWELAGSPQDLDRRRSILLQFEVEAAAFSAATRSYLG